MQRYLLDNNTSGAYAAAALNSADGFDVDFVVRAGQQVSITARITDAYSTAPASLTITGPSGAAVATSQSHGYSSGAGTGTTDTFIATSSGVYTALVKSTGQFTTAQNVAVSAVESGMPATYLTALHPETPSPTNFAWADTVNSQSGSDYGQAYSGPVNYLQWQYVWAGQDAVNLTAKTANVFIKGGPNADALQAQSGSNVLDGDYGSNFLVGAGGTDGGADTFFVDGRGATTWSTAVNFHQGDSATIWGFNDGQSAFEWAPDDGASGYQGATIHAQLAGAGTTTNASFTFAGISLTDAQSKFVISTGSVGGVGYLYVKDAG